MSLLQPKKSILAAPTTQKESLQFLRELSIILISEICYLRKFFPSDEFETGKYHSMNIHTFKKANKIDKMNDILRALTIGIEQSVLEAITLVLKVENTVVESYTITIKNLEGVLDKKGLSHSIEKTLMNLQKNVELLEDVPDDSTISFVISTNGNWAEKNPNFKKTKKESFDLTKYKLGKLETGFHAAAISSRR